ncbi:uncharacterized protein LOC144984140 [Oryzias latipes]
MVKVMQVGSCQITIHDPLGQGALVPPVIACGGRGGSRGVCGRLVPCCLCPAPGICCSSPGVPRRANLRLTVQQFFTCLHLSNPNPSLDPHERQQRIKERGKSNRMREEAEERSVNAHTALGGGSSETGRRAAVISLGSSVLLYLAVDLASGSSVLLLLYLAVDLASGSSHAPSRPPTHLDEAHLLDYLNT